MSIEESIQQIETLIEAWQLDEADLNQTDINAMQVLLKENQELKQKYENAVADYETTMFEKEQLNSLVNSCQEEIRELNKQLEERPKEYVFIGNAQNKTRDFINQITKDNKELKKQQKKFIEYLENEKYRLARECSQIYEDSLGKTRLVNEDIFNEVDKILSKYKEIIGKRKSAGGYIWKYN